MVKYWGESDIASDGFIENSIYFLHQVVTKSKEKIHFRFSPNVNEP